MDLTIHHMYIAMPSIHLSIHFQIQCVEYSLHIYVHMLLWHYNEIFIQVLYNCMQTDKYM